MPKTPSAPSWRSCRTCSRSQGRSGARRASSTRSKTSRGCLARAIAIGVSWQASTPHRLPANGAVRYPVLMHHRSALMLTSLPGVVVTTTESERCFPRHWHGTYGLGVVDFGAQRSLSGRGTVEAFAGQVITHNPCEVHDGHPIGGGRRWRMFHIEQTAMLRLLGTQTVAGREWAAPVFDHPAIRAAVRRAFGALESAGFEGDIIHGATQAYLEEALLIAVGRVFQPQTLTDSLSRSEGRPPGALSRVMERLADQYASSPSLDELAALAGTSRYSLVRQFGRCYGLPPMAWLQQLRLERARAAIANGSPLAEVAMACGFSDQSHLTRLFTRQFGHTPGVLRNASRGTGRSRARTF